MLTILLAGLMTAINLTEWYKVGLLKSIDGYPFGGEGPTPYFYQTAELYSAVNLVWGLLFLATLTFGIWTIIRGHRKRTLLTFRLTLLLWITMLVHANIGSY